MIALYLRDADDRERVAEDLDLVAHLLGERVGGGVAHHRDLALAGVRHAAFAQRHLAPQEARLRPADGEHLAVLLARREHEHLAGRARHAGHLGDARLGVGGQEAGEDVGRVLLRHREIVADLVHAVAGRVLDAARQRQQGERAADRERDAEDRQRGADRPPAQIAQREAGEVHGAAPGARSRPWPRRPARQAGRPARSRRSAGRSAAASTRSSATSPSRMRTQRRQRAARCSSWVTSTSVMPVSRCRLNRRSATASVLALSRLPVGSSASSRRGALTMARAIATRWRSPPESACGRLLIRCAEPDPPERGLGAYAPVLGRDAVAHQRHLDVLARGQRRQQVEFLKHDADLLAPQPRPGAARRDRRAVPQHAAAGRAIDAAQQVDDAALAGAAGPEDRDALAARRSRGRPT